MVSTKTCFLNSVIKKFTVATYSILPSEPNMCLFKYSVLLLVTNREDIAFLFFLGPHCLLAPSHSMRSFWEKPLTFTLRQTVYFP